MSYYRVALLGLLFAITSIVAGCGVDLFPKQNLGNGPYLAFNQSGRYWNHETTRPVLKSGFPFQVTPEYFPEGSVPKFKEGPIVPIQFIQRGKSLAVKTSSVGTYTSYYVGESGQDFGDEAITVTATYQTESGNQVVIRRDVLVRK